MKMRSDCILNKLTPQQLDDVFDSLAGGASYLDVQKRCSAPPPEGFGLKIHINTLHRFYTAERRRRHVEELAESKLDAFTAMDTHAILENVKLELAYACYELAHHPSAPVTVNALSRVTHRFDLAKLEEQRLLLEQQRVTTERDLLAEKKRQFNFNAAREAAKHAAQIHKIIETKGPDNEDKIWMVNDIVFGAASPLPDNSLLIQQNQNSLHQ